MSFLAVGICQNHESAGRRAAGHPSLTVATSKTRTMPHCPRDGTGYTHNPIMSDRQGQDKPSSPMKRSKHNGISERKAAPITKAISNVVTNKLVYPVRALAKSPRHKPQAEPSGDSVEDAQDPKARATSSSALPPPPPDTILQTMQVFVKDKPIRGATIADYCDAVWLEGGANARPFFAPWLESCGKLNISVGGWEEESPTPKPSSPSFVNPWDGETYDRMRTVTFTTQRSGIGPSTADATQIHRLREEGNDRCIVSITVHMNVPFGDSFEVQVRWVVSRAGVDELSVSVGMLVIFNKSCFVENKIRTNTTKETIKGQTNLFEAQRKICRRSFSNGKGVGTQDDEDDFENDEHATETVDANRAGSMQEYKSVFKAIWSMFLFLSGWRLLSYLVNSVVALFRGYPSSAIAYKDSSRDSVLAEIQSAKQNLVELGQLLEKDSVVTPKQAESIAKVVRITNDALRKVTGKVKSN